MKRFGIILCVFWIGFIFYNSSQPATISGGVTSNIVNSIKETVKGESNELEHVDISYSNIGSSFKGVAKNIITTIKTRISNWKNRSTTSKINRFIRKLAHRLEFFVLAILVIFVLSKEKITNIDLIIRTLFIIVMFAILDEYLQSYVPGRGVVVSDVLIDFWGGAFGVLAFEFISKVVYKREEKIIEEKEVDVC